MAIGNLTRAQRRKITKDNKPIKDLLKVIRAYFKDIIPMMKTVKDKRHSSYVVYSTADLLFSMLLADVMTIGNMRGITESFNTDTSIGNFKKILGRETLEELPHHDTINRFLKILESNELEKIRQYMIRQIFNKRSFEQHRYKNKYWLIAVDGTGLHSFKERHCEHCLTRTFTDEETGESKTIYYHSVLEAKLIVGDYVFSIGTEFIENEKENVSKQDCERRAFERLAKRIKQDYKRLPICLLADALYACEPVRTICEKYGWEYIIRYKKGCSRHISNEYETIKEMDNAYEKGSYSKIKSKKIYDYEWVNGIGYNDELINLVDVTIHDQEKDKTKRFWYLSSQKITQHSVVKLVEAGRKRWKIENEGFNVQKKHGYELEHIYCYDYNAMKNHYLLLQMAHIIRQLYDHSSKTAKQLKLSIKKESERLLDCLVGNVLTIQELLEIQASTSQLRLE